MAYINARDISRRLEWKENECLSFNLEWPNIKLFLHKIFDAPKFALYLSHIMNLYFDVLLLLKIYSALGQSVSYTNKGTSEKKIVTYFLSKSTQVF